MKENKIIITIDGPAASGKGTVARLLAKHFNLDYLDSGIIYRLLGFKISNEKVDETNISILVNLAKNLDLTQITDISLLKTEEVAKIASRVAAIKEVREALLEVQRKFAEKSSNGIVTDGRDMGTVIFPTANYKFFLTASIEARSLRRFKELQSSNKSVIYTQVVQELVDRDNRDMSRSSAPLAPAIDAITIDSSNHTAVEVADYIINYIASHNSN
ncbi:MAG: (d)CMP kinase [Sphingobacteriia bacterium]|nr:(d)CMP kinase [Sphingobacteriia bacterium]